jgi:hypothetical protein
MFQKVSCGRILLYLFSKELFGFAVLLCAELALLQNENIGSHTCAGIFSGSHSTLFLKGNGFEDLNVSKIPFFW